MHKLADEIQASIAIPFLHIADATAQRVQSQGIQTIGLLGTRFTMEESFYRGRLSDRHGLTVVIPSEAERAIVHQIIYDELCLGIVNSEARQQYVAIIQNLLQAGAEGIILGCTEIELLIQTGDVACPLFPTSRIHAEAAVERAIAGKSFAPFENSK
jgi:aspartate racemase